MSSQGDGCSGRSFLHRPASDTALPAILVREIPAAGGLLVTLCARLAQQRVCYASSSSCTSANFSFRPACGNSNTQIRFACNRCGGTGHTVQVNRSLGGTTSSCGEPQSALLPAHALRCRLTQQILVSCESFPVADDHYPMSRIGPEGTAKVPRPFLHSVMANDSHV